MSDSIPHARITVSVAAGVASVEIDNPSQLDALTKVIFTRICGVPKEES
jgi:hypothetical protein